MLEKLLNRNFFVVLFLMIFQQSSVEVVAGGVKAPYSLFDNKGVSFDTKLSVLLNYKNGFFIEAGAHDGVLQSNTKQLEEYQDWAGILVEPSAVLYPNLLNNRPKSHCFCCALGAFSEDNTYIWGDFNGSLMASVNGVRLSRQPKEKVLVRSLQSIIDEVGVYHINFLSLDTEGYEYNILQGIDFNKTIFDYMLIEIYITEYDAIVSFLESKGYDLVENFSNYNPNDNPIWDGTHNDYLFKRR